MAAKPATTLTTRGEPVNDTYDAETQAYAIKAAWRLGFLAGEHALASRLQALEGAWKHVAAPTWEEQVRRRIAQALALAAASGRGEYRGGYVSWDDDADLAVAA